jgi:hypothetical protein
MAALKPPLRRAAIAGGVLQPCTASRLRMRLPCGRNEEEP